MTVLANKLLSMTCFVGVYAHAQLALMEIYLELGEHKQWLDMVPKLKNMKVCSVGSTFEARNSV